MYLKRFFTLAFAVPALSAVTESDANGAFNQLQKWYNKSTGLWNPSTGWWNSANCSLTFDANPETLLGRLTVE